MVVLSVGHVVVGDLFVLGCCGEICVLLGYWVVLGYLVWLLDYQEIIIVGVVLILLDYLLDLLVLTFLLECRCLWAYIRIIIMIRNIIIGCIILILHNKSSTILITRIYMLICLSLWLFVIDDIILLIRLFVEDIAILIFL